MNNKTTLYSYSDSWSNELHSKTLKKTVKRAYLIRGLTLLIVLPFDIAYTIFTIPFKKRSKILFVTEKWPELTEIISKRAFTASVSSPAFIFKSKLSRIKYIPASVFYVPTAIGLFLPEFLQKDWSRFVVFMFKKVVKIILSHDATLVVHSDALPFARGLVIAANELGMKTVCIQHGNFREVNVIKEQEGFLCSHNIVRSKEDANIVARSSSKTVIHILPEFFKIRIKDNIPKLGFPNILLLGEGYHIIDNSFNDKYLDFLELIQDELEKLGAKVVFRPHPSERNFRWEKRFREINKDPLEVCLGKVNAVVGYTSTVLHESSEAGIPAFYIDLLSNGHILSGRNNSTIRKFIDSEKLIDFLTKNSNEDNISNISCGSSIIYKEAIDILVG